MAEDPKEFLKRMSKKRDGVTSQQPDRAQQFAHKLFSTGKGTRMFYYPGCGSDFAYALLHFSDRCDTFIFCDWSKSKAETFVNAITEIAADRPRRNPDTAPAFIHFPVDAGDVKELANMERFLTRFFREMPANLAAYLSDPPSSKGHYAELWVAPKPGHRRFVRVFWLAMEGVNLYWKLFARKGTAPRILCIKNWGLIGGEWTPFGDCWAHLAHVVRDGPRQPEFLIACEGKHDWPWTKRVAQFDDWGDTPVIMWARQKP